MSNDHPNEEEIFYAAREICDDAERSAYLDEACAGDSALRSRVEAVIEASEAQDTFLRAPVLAGMTTIDTSSVTEGPGDVIGRYKLLQQIGEGGFGVVYMADQLEPVRRRVALKVIKLGMDTNSVVARFEAERQALAMMEHPNIARAFDAGATETGRPYFVMELVRGIPITEYCDRNNLSTEERLELFIQVCSAVQHAHQKGVIHRDLKPSNVLVTLHDGKPVPKVIDFGIARAMDRPLTERTLFTSFGQFIGTPQYMSPEQAEISGLDVDTRADIYTLGVLLYELLTGTPPFEEDTLRSGGYDEMCRIIREVEPPKPSTRISTMGDRLTEVAKHRHAEPAALGKLIRGDLDWIVMKALEKDRTRRYETATGLAEDVQRHLNDEPVVAGPPGVAYRLRKFVRRNRVKVTASVLVAVALVLGLSLAAVGLVQAIRQRDRALEAYRAQAEAERKQEFAEQRADEQEQLADAERQAKDVETAAKREVQRWRSLIQAHSLMESGAYGQALERLKAAASIKHDYATRLALWGLARLYSDHPLTTLRGHGSRVETVAFSPDGKTLASGSEDGTVKLWDVATGRERHSLTGHRQVVRSVAFSPDGTMLASGSHDTTVKLWDVSTGEELRTLTGHTGIVVSVAFSPAGSTLASGSTDRTIRIWDIATGEEVRVLTAHTDQVRSVAFSPDGSTLASGSWDNTIRLWDVAAGRELRTLEHWKRVYAVAFSPDGQTLASGGADKTIRLWSLATGQELRTLRGHGNVVESVAFAPDGKVLASGSWRGLKLWDVATGGLGTPTGRELHTFGSGTRCAAFSPDGKTLASGVAYGNTIKLWDVSRGRGVRERLVPGHWILSLAVSPDGKTLASGASGELDREKFVRLWDLQTGEELRAFGDSDGVWCVAFSPDGKALASGSKDGTIKLWEVATGRELRTLTGHSDRAYCVAFSPDGKTLASGSADRTRKLWEVATGRELRTLGGVLGPTWSIAFSPDGKTLASSSWGGIVRLWDVATGAVLWKANALLGGHEGAVESVAFSPDGMTLASAGDDQTVRLWEAATGRELLTLGGHTDFVLSVAFSPDGSTLASGSRDGTLRLWDVVTGAELVTIGPLRPWEPPNPGFIDVYRLVFSPDGRTLSCAVGYEILTYDFHGYDQKIERWLGEAWYSQGHVHANLGRWEKAVDCYSAAIELEPDNWGAWYSRGYVHAELGRFEKAALDFAKAAELHPDGAHVRYFQALTQLALGDTEGYRKSCASMLESFGQTEESEVAFWPAWTCVLAPDAAEVWGQTVQLAQRAVESDEENDRYLRTLGAVLYRAGRFVEAIERLSELAAGWDHRKEMPTIDSPAYTWFFLAMAHYQEGHLEESRKWLDRAVARAEQEIRDKPLWNRRLTLEILRREAESVLHLSEEN